MKRCAIIDGFVVCLHLFFRDSRMFRIKWRLSLQADIPLKYRPQISGIDGQWVQKYQNTTESSLQNMVNIKIDMRSKLM